MSATYVLQIIPDTDFDIEGDLEFQEDKDAAYANGVFGYQLLQRYERKGRTVERTLDSCFGFIGTDNMLESMYEQCAHYLPAGVSAEVED